MFLVNSLNDKLKRTMIEMDPEKNQTCLFPYQKRPTNGAVITVHKHETINELDSQKLSNLSKKEWESTFTLPKLRKKWKEKINVSFDPNHKKISDDIVSQKTKEAKEYVKDLIDPDNLEIKNKRFNASVNPEMNNYPDLKKTLFEVTQGLNNFQVVPLKEKKVEEGVDSRNTLYIDGEKWNNSTLFENWEKKYLSQTTRESAQENTIKYWRTTEFDRINESLLPISEERKKLEMPRYFHRYKSPIQDTKFRYNTMQKVKELTWFEREKVAKKVLHENPGSSLYPEKINSLINKQMSNIYKEKYNELTGKTKRINTAENIRKDWKDEELTEKIKTLQEWKDIDWFKPIQTEKGSPRIQGKAAIRRELLKPLVTKGTSILKEEENIKARIAEEYKRKLKLELLQKKNRGYLSLDSRTTSNMDELRKSKYPIDKGTYDKLLQEAEKNKSADKSLQDRGNNNEQKENTIVFSTENNIIPVVQPLNTKYFLEAYKKVTLDELKLQKKRLKKDQWIEYQYMHFGTYREFEFKSKVITDPELNQFKVKNEKIKAWSCCMNTDENSRGCRKIKINKLKWNLDHA